MVALLPLCPVGKNEAADAFSWELRDFGDQNPLSPSSHSFSRIAVAVAVKVAGAVFLRRMRIS